MKNLAQLRDFFNKIEYEVPSTISYHFLIAPFNSTVTIVSSTMNLAILVVSAVSTAAMTVNLVR